jgi:hypothetical protein
MTTHRFGILKRGERNSFFIPANMIPVSSDMSLTCKANAALRKFSDFKIRKIYV